MAGSSGKKADILYALCLSIIFAIIDYAALALLVEPLSRILPIENTVFSNIVHMSVISVVGTLLGCLAFGAFKERKYLVPHAYSFFPAWVAICYLYVLFNVEPDQRSFAAGFISLYTLIPTLTGLLISWGIYLRKYRSPS